MRCVNVAGCLFGFFNLFGLAHAADLPPAEPYQAPAAVVEERFSWTGVYVGANGGYGTGQFSNTGGTTGDRISGGIAGGQIGANYQAGALVVGVEGDFQATWQQRTLSGAFFGVGFTAFEELPWFGTARARLGLATGRALFYLTGGAGYGDIKAGFTALNVTVSSEAQKAFWTAGGGIEWMFIDRWSVKGEYLYLDTGNTTVTLLGFVLNGRLQDHIGRIGINYHF